MESTVNIPYSNNNIIRLKFTFKGIIQGVGFRPSIYRCAVSMKLAGFVQNRKSEVVAEVEGPKKNVESFENQLKKYLPSAAKIEDIKKEEVIPRGDNKFYIADSLVTAYDFPPIPPDLAICEDCKKELFNPNDRRFLYPFITCTQCGPRYSIVEDTPFDRETTSMIDFPQCDSCLSEYTDPLNRRFHSQTNSCEICGPKLTLCSSSGELLDGDPIVNTIKALNSGKIVAIQGIGGFHLAANPDFPEAVKKLRSDKERLKKPFALMVKDIDTAKEIANLDSKDISILTSSIAPILILQKRKDISKSLKTVSDLETLGIFLPYTPLHLLLFFHPNVPVLYSYLIMTSGNIKDEPIITEPQKAKNKLGNIADLFLYNNRRILFRTDDSIVRKSSQTGVFIMRRSRGYVPGLIHLKEKSNELILAAGGDLKNAPALLKGNDVYLAPYIGDLSNPVTMNDFEKQIDRMLALYQINPDRIICDMHPEYFSSKWAKDWASQRNVENLTMVQHHHAHILSVMAEYGLNEIIGLSFDGTGYGTDGTIWGGEFLYCTRSSFNRIGWFDTFLLPGGEMAIKNPIRITFSILSKILGGKELFSLFAKNNLIRPHEIDLIIPMIDKGLNSPRTSSLGRIFDAASAALGLVDYVTYEGEGPIRLENLALKTYESIQGNAHKKLKLTERTNTNMPYGSFKTIDGGNNFSIDMSETILYLLTNKDKFDLSTLALDFHASIAQAALEGSKFMRNKTGINMIALSGGVFQNLILRELLYEILTHNGFKVFFNIKIPPGDGGLSVGQVYFKG